MTAGGFGYIDSAFAFVDLGPNIDRNYLNGLTTRAGLSVADMIGRISSAMTQVNTGQDELIAELIYPTTNVLGGTRRKTNKQIKRGGELTVPRPQRGASVRTMLPITKFDVGLGFTEDGLQTISEEMFNEEVQDIVDAWRRLYLIETLTALFDPTPVPVDTELETAALSPRFAGSGSGDNAFSGFYPNGQPLPGGYTHYGYAANANMATTIATYVARLRMWQRGPFDAICSEGMVALLKADTANFVSAGSILVRPGVGDAQALLDPETYVGSYMGDIRIRAGRPELGTTNHMAIYKSAGSMAPGNPLAWRYDPLYGRELWTRSRSMFPLADAYALQRFGIGVSNRTSAVLLYFASSAPGAYAPPTIA